MKLENAWFAIEIGDTTGAIESLVVKKTGIDLIGEKRLVSAYRICAEIEGYQCNYANSADQKPAQVTLEGDTVTVKQRGMMAARGPVDIGLTYTITLDGDAVKFRASLTNHSDNLITEFWFPQIGGITKFDENGDIGLASAPYNRCCRHDRKLVKDFPGRMEIGSEAAEFYESYPGLCMPWWDLYDEATDTGLYLGYHDPILRMSTWHLYLYPTNTGILGRSMMTPEEACGEPNGYVFSHVRYPYLKKGESFETGEFILRVHDGDWHYGVKYYRKWFDEHFPFDKKDSWLRKKSAWYACMLYQPEDKITADYKTFDKWCAEAEAYGVDCHEINAWDRGGQDRFYPEYVPEEKLGGLEGFREMIRSTHERGARSLIFANYNVMDCCSDWYHEELHKYAHQDAFGNSPNWMCWGQSTLIARSQLSVRRQRIASVVPEFEAILDQYLLERVRDGADGFQLDKLCVGSLLDFNPLNTRKPDEALCEGLVQGVARLWHKCREINPDFRFASEDGHDRLIPYADIGYRCAHYYGVSPLRYVFPEWAGCQHVNKPLDFEAVNAGIMTGSVLCIEPFNYQNSMGHPVYRTLSEYVQEVERIRAELKDIIFLGEYCDNLYATVTAMKDVQSADARSYKIGGEVMVPGGGSAAAAGTAGELHYRMHKDWSGEHLAIVIANSDNGEISYTWQADEAYEREAVLYAPFEQPRRVTPEELPTIKGLGLHILVMEKKR